MGMQQIILLALAVIIVGIATVYGIEAFTLNRTRSNMDAIIQDLVVMGTEAQQWKARPSQFGGQGADPLNEAFREDPVNFTGFDFVKIGRKTGAGPDSLGNMNGVFKILSSNNPLTISGCNAAEGNYIEVDITGIRDEEIVVDNTTRKTGDPSVTDAGC